MKTFLIAFSILAVMLAIPASAQLATTQTTLSSAVSANSSAEVCVASVTGVVLPSLSSGISGSYFVVDKEAIAVVAQGTSSTCYKIKRGQLGTSANYGHASGATVWVGAAATGTGDTSRPFSGGAITSNVPTGTCVATSQYTLPVIVVRSANDPFTGQPFYCIAGSWGAGVQQVSSLKPYTAFATTVQASGVAGGSTTQVAGTTWFSQLYIPTSVTLTGACVRNGATVGTDKYIVAIWDAAGTLLANSATAGTTTAGASIYQCVAFTATVAVSGPQTYYVGIQTNGTTDNFFTYAAGGAPTSYGTNSFTGTFGTLTAITPTLTFTAAKGPLMMVY